MNKVILMGRLTRDPEVRYSNGANGQTAVARFLLAVDGYGYTIKLDYGGLTLSKSGYAAYPFHSEKKYHEVVRKIQQEIENLCEKYVENYSPEGIEDRLGL